MDSIVIFDKVVGFLCNPPTVVPRLDSVKLRALCQHIMKALKQLECPQSFIRGWLGLTMPLVVNTLLKPNPFVLPGDLSPAPVYTTFATPAPIKMIDAMINQSIAPAFNQFVHNQLVLQNQIAATAMVQPSPALAPAQQYIVPPVPHIAFPMQQPFQAPMQQQHFQKNAGFGRGQQGQFQEGHGGQGGWSRGHAGSRGGRQRRLSFMTMIRNQ
jgi:hypothetical protein